MKNLVKITLLLALATLWPSAKAQEMARVISSTPVMQTVTLPRQVCTETPVVIQRQRSGAGAVVGAITGGILGSQVGNGSGQTAATALGIIGGAILGDQIEGEPAPVVRMANSCTQQITTENRVVGYNVVYEYAGRQYTTQMSTDPGSHIPVHVTPSVSQTQVYTTPVPPAPVVVQAPAQVRTYPPIIVAPAHRPSVYYSPPVYTAPVVNFRWDIGGHRGRGHGHGHGHGHHRGHGYHGDGFSGRWR